MPQDAPIYPLIRNPRLNQETDSRVKPSENPNPNRNQNQNFYVCVLFNSSKLDSRIANRETNWNVYCWISINRCCWPQGELSCDLISGCCLARAHSLCCLLTCWPFQWAPIWFGPVNRPTEQPNPRPFDSRRASQTKQTTRRDNLPYNLGPFDEGIWMRRWT